MINFKKVFTIKAFSLILCILLPCQTIVFAAPISCSLRVPISFNTNKRLSKTMLVELLISHFKVISMDSQDMKIIHSFSDEIQEEKTWENFINDEGFRDYALSSIIIGLPENIQELWDISDALGLNDEDVTWLIEKAHEGIKQSSISLPGMPGKIEARLPIDFIANNVKKLGLGSPIDKQLKNLIRANIPSDLTHNTEQDIRLMAPNAKNTLFLISLFQQKNCYSNIFRSALKLFLSLSQSEKKSDIVEMLETRRKHEFAVIFQNQRFDEMPDIFSHMIAGDSINLDERLKAGKSEIPTIQTVEGSFPYLSGRIAIQKARKNIELLDYLLNLDEEAVPDALNKAAFDIDKALSPKSERIRTVRDYRDMYFKIYPVDKNKEELIKMSLAVLKKLYLLLNEDVRLLKELKSKMKERGDAFQETVITPRLSHISIIKYSMLEAFKKIERLYKNRDYEDAEREALALYGDIYKNIFSNSYPTIINVDFIDILKEEANDAGIQDILKRLNEIDFGSCRLIEFMTTALSEEYSVLRYPYVYDFNNIFLFGKTENPWENFSAHFKEKENVDISGIRRVSGDGPRDMNFIAFGETIEIMIYELLKNAVTNADYDPSSRMLKGEILEDFEDTLDGYCYTMEDNNSGISRDRLRSVFNICVSYTRFDPNKPRYKEFAGLGIGLAKVLAIVDMYGGKLRVVSRTQGKETYELTYEKGAFSGITLSDKDNLRYLTGTKFFITFPYSVIDMASVLPQQNEEAEDGSLPLNSSKQTNTLASNQTIKTIPSIRGIGLLLSKIEELKKSRAPLLVCISGEAGAGKSAFAKLIARRISKSLIIRIDDFYKQVDGAFWVLNEKKAAEAINRNIKNGEYDVIIVEGFEAFSVARWLKAMNRKSFAGKRKAFDIHVRLIADDTTRYNNIKQKQDFSLTDKDGYMHDADIWSYVQELQESESLNEKPDYVFDNSADKRPVLASNEGVRAIEGFAPQEITDKFGNRYYIEKVAPVDYFSYAKEFLRIYQEEMRLLRDSENVNDYFGIDMFNGLYANLIEGAESKDIMAFFVLKTALGKIIGGRIFYNPEIVPGFESEVVTGIDVIRFKSQNAGLGVQLRSITFKWLREKGYTRYGALIHDHNERSLKNLKRVSSELNATISTTADPEFYILELPGATQTIPAPGLTEAINSSL